MNSALSRSPRLGGRQSGFTLVEVIVVLSVILLLTGIAVPMLSSYMEDGRRARAESEAKMLGAAVMSFYKDTGVYPARSNAGVNNYSYVLFTGPTKPTTNPFGAGHSWVSWGMGARGDILDNHLLQNMPGGQVSAAYPSTGNTQWRGPYLAGGAPLDPWGRPYMINVISGWYNHATYYKRLYVLSAGPNGIFDTHYSAQATTDIAGDDLGLMLSQKQ